MTSAGGGGGADGADDVVRRRRQVARLADAGQRLGYLLYAVAVAAFVVGAVAGFSTPSVTVVIAALAVGSALLAPAIVAGYAVKAAEREDRERARRIRNDEQKGTNAP